MAAPSPARSSPRSPASSDDLFVPSPASAASSSETEGESEVELDEDWQHSPPPLHPFVPPPPPPASDENQQILAYFQAGRDRFGHLFPYSQPRAFLEAWEALPPVVAPSQLVELESYAAKLVKKGDERVKRAEVVALVTAVKTATRLLLRFFRFLRVIVVGALIRMKEAQDAGRLRESTVDASCQHLASVCDQLEKENERLMTKMLSLVRRRCELARNVIATDVLNEYFAAHEDYPYPSVEEKQRLAGLCNLSVKQVNYFFGNKRTRYRRRARRAENAVALGGSE